MIIISFFVLSNKSFNPEYMLLETVIYIMNMSYSLNPASAEYFEIAEFEFSRSYCICVCLFLSNI